MSKITLSSVTQYGLQIKSNLVKLETLQDIIEKAYKFTNKGEMISYIVFHIIKDKPFDQRNISVAMLTLFKTATDLGVGLQKTIDELWDEVFPILQQSETTFEEAVKLLFPSKLAKLKNKSSAGRHLRLIKIKEA